MNHKMNRRHFSRWLGQGMFVYGATSALGLSGLGSLACGAVRTDTPNIATETLAQYAYYLLPVLEPAHARFRAVADKVSLLAGQVPEISNLVEAGIEALNSGGKGLWLSLPPQEKLGIVKDFAGTPFFKFMHWFTAEIVMRDPALWASLGYQGSAIEQGGYLYRGFDDIDWLPRPGQGS